MPENNKAVNIKDLSFRYLSSKRLDQGKAILKKVLDGVSFDIARGEKISIIGPNGAGKSTLLLNLAGLSDDKYKDGSIEVFGRKMDKRQQRIHVDHLERAFRGGKSDGRKKQDEQAETDGPQQQPGILVMRHGDSPVEVALYL